MGMFSAYSSQNIEESKTDIGNLERITGSLIPNCSIKSYEYNCKNNKYILRHLGFITVVRVYENVFYLAGLKLTAL